MRLLQPHPLLNLLLHVWLATLGFNLFPLALALHASEAGVVDWHRPLIGVPVTSTSNLSPTFHRFTTGTNKKSTQSIVLTATASNALAALDPVKGDIAWRYVFDASDPIVAFQALGHVVVSLSGRGKTIFRAFDTLKGDLLTEKHLHKDLKPTLSALDDVAGTISATYITFSKTNGDITTIPHSGEEDGYDVFILTNGHIVRRLGATSGRVHWEWSAPDMTSSVIYTRIVQTPTTLFVIGLTKGFSTYSLHVTALCASSGKVLSDIEVPSSLAGGFMDLAVLSDRNDESIMPMIAWLEQGGQLQFMPLMPDLKGKSKAMKGETFGSIKDIGLSDHGGYFVALMTNGSPVALKIDKGSQGLYLITEFSDSATSDKSNESIFAGGFDKENNPYIAKLFWSHLLGVVSVNIYAENAASGKGLMRGYTLPFDADVHGKITHAALDVANPSEFLVIGRFAITTTTGVIQLWQHDHTQWTREEGLAELVMAEFVELPEEKGVLTNVDLEHETLAKRARRQISEAKGLPQYLVHFVRRFVTGSYASMKVATATARNLTTATAVNTTGELLVRDEFGFRKVIVAMSRRGVVYGIDSTSGAVVWRRRLDGCFSTSFHSEQNDYEYVPLKSFVIRTVADTGGEAPQVVLLARRRSAVANVDTVLIHIDALTGADVQAPSAAGTPSDASSSTSLQKISPIKPGILDAFMMVGEMGENKTVVLIDEHMQVRLYPDDDETRKAFQVHVPRLYFALRDNDDGKAVRGYQLRLLPATSEKVIESTKDIAKAYSTWRTKLPQGETILSTFQRPHDERVASLGSVLGNRSTLYKYLNPRLAGYLTASALPASPAEQTATVNGCGIYLLDRGKGTIVYHVMLPPSRGACDHVHAVLAENWLLYTYFEEEATTIGHAKGHRVVSVELYEGNGVDDATKSSESSMYYNRSTEVNVLEWSFVLPYAVSALSVTETKFGITRKDLIVSTDRGHIQWIPRRFLDPRRPEGKPTAEEAEEGLIQYEPVILDDPHRAISHTYRIANIQQILTSPALLESTSLIFAYGSLDLFGSRIAPSGTFDVLNENFNKMQLVLTIAALSTAIIVTRPMVRRKTMREQWY